MKSERSRPLAGEPFAGRFAARSAASASRSAGRERDRRSVLARAGVIGRSCVGVQRATSCRAQRSRRSVRPASAGG